MIRSRGSPALGRAGIQFSEDQKATIKALVETGDIAKAQGLILDELATQFGGQAEAAAKAGLGFLDQFRNAWGDMQEIVGGNLAEIARPLVGVLQSLAEGFAGAARADAEIQRDGSASRRSPSARSIGGGRLAGRSASARSALRSRRRSPGSPRSGPALVAFWPQIEATIGWFKNAWGEMSIFEKAFAPVSLALRAMADIFIAVFPETAAAVAKAVAEIKEWLTGALGRAFDWVTGKVGAVGDAFANLYDRVVGHSYVPDMVSEVGAEFGKLQGNMVDPAIAATDQVGAEFQDLATGVGTCDRRNDPRGRFHVQGLRLADARHREPNGGRDRQ